MVKRSARSRSPARRPARRAPRVFGWALVLLVSLLMLLRVALAPDPATPAGTRTALAQLAHLESGLDGSADRMQDLFP
jgi:hypothetical protein